MASQTLALKTCPNNSLSTTTLCFSLSIDTLPFLSFILAKTCVIGICSSWRNVEYEPKVSTVHTLHIGKYTQCQSVYSVSVYIPRTSDAEKFGLCAQTSLIKTLDNTVFVISSREREKRVMNSVQVMLNFAYSGKRSNPVNSSPSSRVLYTFLRMCS